MCSNLTLSRTTLTLLITFQTDPNYPPNSLLGRISATCRRHFAQDVPLGDQHVYEVIRQVILHATDIHPARFLTLAEVDAFVTAQHRPTHLLVRRVPWGPEGVIFQRALKRYPVGKVELRPLLELCITAPKCLSM